ncbi:MAG: hypothetical protein GTO53_06545 [Planctomycetales bacterium]|nr:hypothetical protein [Planctomycetales bacterium]NIM08800.1 hypothetical protein [Planctomycetales bacterium]NIN08265.1 hypothetical protein [Planctomycetales bacterium]NIN77390.1 hypothetical protein [Planctomycetales bacterium]NIO34227.1 hypothetical protein [Planctomycetales bacterium]
MIEMVHQQTLQTLRNHLQAAGAEFREEDGDILCNGHRMGLCVVFDGFVPQGPQQMAPVEIQIHLDGDRGDRFRVGVLGVGPNQEAAVQSAIEEWYLLLVTPLLAALGAAANNRLREPPPLQIDSWHIYPGRAGIRGRLPAGLEPGGTLFRQLIHEVGQTVADWKTGEVPELRSLMVMANSAGRQQEVQAAIDGFVDENLTQRLGQLTWPTASEAYFYKQVFVLRSATPGPEVDSQGS